MPTPLRVLIVEDTPDDAELMTLHLTADGFQPDWTRVQTEADYLAQLGLSPDLILADWSLPQFSGLRALQLMRTRGLDIPFLIVSGSVGEEAAIDALRQGAYDYVLKDRPARLGQAVRRALEDSQLRQERKRAEVALQESEARYRRLADNARDIIFRYSIVPEMRLTYINPAVQAITGYTPEECYADPVLMLNMAHPDDAPMMAGFLRSFTLPEKSLLMRWIGKDGAARWMESSVIPVFDAAGQMVAIEGITRDITERKQAEDALRESEKEFHSLAEAMPQIVWITRADGWNIYFNQQWVDYTGLTLEESYGHGWNKPFHPDDQPRAWDAWQNAVNNNATYLLECRLRRADGVYTWWLIRGVPLLDAQGTILKWFGTCTDINGLKQAEEEREQLLQQIQEQARQLAQVMRTVPEGVLLLDAAGRIVLANPRAEGDLLTLAGAQVGDPLARLGDRTLAELLNPPPAGLWHEAHGGGRIFEIIAKPIATGLSPENWVLVLRDVTEEREARQRALQGERLAAVGQMAAGIAHDFNNILAVIALDARLALAASDRVADVRARLTAISGQAQRAADLVRQILDFSRRAVLERRPVALRPFLVEQMALLARTLPESITVELAGDDACTVSADPTRLQQIVMNLAVNARDAMPAGGRLRFTLARVPALPADLQPMAAAADETAAWVRLTVADSGTGIPPEVLPRIFEPFFTTKGPGKGSGLGLAQIHGIVKQHGGEIGVSTQAGVGTTFTIYLPALVSALAASAVAEPVIVADEAPAAAGQTILIVEDDPTLRDALVDTVDLLGYRTLSAANGREALAVLAQHGEIALIMSDLVMPEMGGRALLQELKQRGVTAPVVILSGHPLDDELDSLQALGLSGWLLKPPEIEQLARLLAQAL